MEVEFDVKIKAGDLYDYMLRHTYSGLSGILGTIVGILLIANFVINGGFISAIIGVVVILYLPWTLFLKSQQQAAGNPAFKEPLHFKMTDAGVEISQGDAVQQQAWSDMVKAVSTQKSIILYTSKVNASIFPKRELGEKIPAIIEMISTHMPPNKVKIKA
ncbi:MAG: YcxB family protein [Lachnospiraceae bacterium]|nr:YcxB family protein [Lachnospiraceae bacterium]